MKKCQRCGTDVNDVVMNGKKEASVRKNVRDAKVVWIDERKMRFDKIKKNKDVIYAVLFGLTLVISSVAVYDWFFNNPIYYCVQGEVVSFDVHYGGCQHTDFVFVEFSDGRNYKWNPSIEICEYLLVNKTYTFYLCDRDIGDGVFTAVDRILDESGEIWRSPHYV